MQAVGILGHQRKLADLLRSAAGVRVDHRATVSVDAIRISPTAPCIDAVSVGTGGDPVRLRWSGIRLQQRDGEIRYTHDVPEPEDGFRVLSLAMGGVDPGLGPTLSYHGAVVRRACWRYPGIRPD